MPGSCFTHDIMISILQNSSVNNMGHLGENNSVPRNFLYFFPKSELVIFCYLDTAILCSEECYSQKNNKKLPSPSMQLALRGFTRNCLSQPFAGIGSKLQPGSAGLWTSITWCIRFSTACHDGFKGVYRPKMHPTGWVGSLATFFQVGYQLLAHGTNLKARQQNANGGSAELPNGCEMRNTLHVVWKTWNTQETMYISIYYVTDIPIQFHDPIMYI